MKPTIIFRWALGVTIILTVCAGQRTCAQNDSSVSDCKVEPQTVGERPTAGAAANNKSQLTLDLPTERIIIAKAGDKIKDVVASCTLDPRLGTVGWKALFHAKPFDPRGNPLPAAGPSAQLAQQIRKGNQLHLDVSKLPPGNYTVQVSAWRHDHFRSAVEPDVTGTFTLTVAGPGVALVVGNDYYETPAFAPLHHAVDDAIAMKDRLQKMGYLEENIIYVLGAVENGKPKLYTNVSGVERDQQHPECVTSTLITWANKALAARAVELLAHHALIFYAGCGKLHMQDGSTLADNMFVCYDGNLVSIVKSAVDVAGSLVKSGKDRPTIIGIYDTCRNAEVGKLFHHPDISGVNYFALYSCQAGESSNEDSDDPTLSLGIKHGFFTASLLETVAQMMANPFIPDQLSLGAVINSACQKLHTLMETAHRINATHPGTYSEPQQMVTTDDLSPRAQRLPLLVRLGPPQ